MSYGNNFFLYTKALTFQRRWWSYNRCQPHSPHSFFFVQPRSPRSWHRRSNASPRHIISYLNNNVLWKWTCPTYSPELVLYRPLTFHVAQAYPKAAPQKVELTVIIISYVSCYFQRTPFLWCPFQRSVQDKFRAVEVSRGHHYYGVLWKP